VIEQKTQTEVIETTKIPTAEVIATMDSGNNMTTTPAEDATTNVPVVTAMPGFVSENSEGTTNLVAVVDTTTSAAVPRQFPDSAPVEEETTNISNVDTTTIVVMPGFVTHHGDGPEGTIAQATTQFSIVETTSHISTEQTGMEPTTTPVVQQQPGFVMTEPSVILTTGSDIETTTVTEATSILATEPQASGSQEPEAEFVTTTVGQIQESATEQTASLKLSEDASGPFQNAISEPNADRVAEPETTTQLEQSTTTTEGRPLELTTELSERITSTIEAITESFLNIEVNGKNISDEFTREFNKAITKVLEEITSTTEQTTTEEQVNANSVDFRIPVIKDPVAIKQKLQELIANVTRQYQLTTLPYDETTVTTENPILTTIINEAVTKLMPGFVSNTPTAAPETTSIEETVETTTTDVNAPVPRKLDLEESEQLHNELVTEAVRLDLDLDKEDDCAISGMFSCGSGCIERSRRCNLITDCEYGSDEIECGKW
jgi:hypothetical protein